PIAILTILYFLAGKLGLNFVFQYAVTPVWPCSGIALAAILIYGYRMWPGIFLGAFLLNFSEGRLPATSLAIATGNTLEGLAGAFLTFWLAGGSNVMKRSKDIFKFALLGAMASSTIAATIGVRSLVWEVGPKLTSTIPTWKTWWLGDTVGIV